MHTPINAEELRERIALHLIVRRKAKRMSQEEFANDSGLDRSFVGHVEQGRRNLTLDNLIRLANALEIEPYELLQPISITSSEAN